MFLLLLLLAYIIVTIVCTNYDFRQVTFKILIPQQINEKSNLVSGICLHWPKSVGTDWLIDRASVEHRRR